jgi:hypothetical protein
MSVPKGLILYSGVYILDVSIKNSEGKRKTHAHLWLRYYGTLVLWSIHFGCVYKEFRRKEETLLEVVHRPTFRAMVFYPEISDQ